MSVDVLRTGEAGGRVIRGGALRGSRIRRGNPPRSRAPRSSCCGISASRTSAATGSWSRCSESSPPCTDAGLTAVGSRELAILPVAERPALLRNLVGLRITLTLAGVVVATGFALVAGYPGVVVAGTAIAGVGVVLVNTQATLMMPLAIELRYGAITLIETLRHALTLVGVAVLVIAGASLLPFFGVQVAVGVVVLLLTPLFVVGVVGMRPVIERATARELLRESLPLAAALAMNIVYLRLLVILVSIQTDEVETGLFVTGFRIFEILLGIPTLILAVALPLLAVAGAEDRERLRYALQQMTEAAVTASLLLVLVTVVLAEPAILLLGGEQYRDAVPILQVLAFALLGIFLSQVWTLGLISLRRQRDVAVANAIALAFVLVLGVVLIRAYSGIGGAAAAVATEGVARGAHLLVPRPGRSCGAPEPSIRATAARRRRRRRAGRAPAAVPVGRRAAGGRRLHRRRGRDRRGSAGDRAGVAWAEAAVSRPRVVVLRGHNANPWDLRPWALLQDEFDVSVLVTGSNRFDLEDLDLPVVRGKALRDRLPRGRVGDLASQAPGDRYLDLERHLSGADIVHSAELGVWFSGQPAALKERLGFRLVLTVWETIPFRDTFRAFRGRKYRREALAHADLFLAATERARRCLLLEGATAERIEVSYPGVDVERFRGAQAARRRRPPRRLARPARLGEGPLRRDPRPRRPSSSRRDC